MHKKIKISVIIPSAPDRSFEAILQNLEKIKPPHVEMEIFIIKGTWPPLQRNMGIKAATGDYIFFFDDDIIIPAGSIEAALATFEENPEIQVVGGPNITPLESSFIQQCIGQAHASFFTGLQTSIRYRKSRAPKTVNENHLITCNLAFRTKILKENLFNPALFANEENELLGRLVRKGNLLAYNPDFFIYHHRRKNIAQYAKQIFKWGEGRTLHTIKRPAHFKPTFFIPLLFLGYCISLIWLHPTETNSTVYYLPLVTYLILALIFSTITCMREKNSHRRPRWSYLLVLPWLFFVTHISYAFGLLWGFFTIFKELHLPEEKDFLLIKIELV